MVSHSKGTLAPGRRELYERIASLVGKTRLGEIKNVPVPNNNRIFYKEEYRNPTGSHYDRGMYRLLRHMEEKGEIEPGATLVETTTGNSGAAFAWVCRILGYECKLLMPADMPSARIAHIESFGAEIEFTPARLYVKGLIDSFKRYLVTHKTEATTDHAADEEHLLEGMRDLGREIISDLDTRGVRKLDYFVAALGNGSSSRGVGSVLIQKYKTALIGVEPMESPTVFARKFPDEFRRRFGDVKLSGQHGLIGTGPGETGFGFPNMKAITDQLQDIILVGESEWKRRLVELADFEGQHVGNTSAACLHAALEMAGKDSNKTILVIFYDPAWKYLDIRVESKNLNEVTPEERLATVHAFRP